MEQRPSECSPRRTPCSPPIDPISYSPMPQAECPLAIWVKCPRSLFRLRAYFHLLRLQCHRRREQHRFHRPHRRRHRRHSVVVLRVHRLRSVVCLFFSIIIYILGYHIFLVYYIFFIFSSSATTTTSQLGNADALWSNPSTSPSASRDVPSDDADAWNASWNAPSFHAETTLSPSSNGNGNASSTTSIYASNAPTSAPWWTFPVIISYLLASRYNKTHCYIDT
jgi:hypothetical protein